MQCAFESPAVIVPPGALTGADGELAGEVVTVGCGAGASGGFVAAPDEFSAVADGGADAELDGDADADSDADGDGDGDADSDGDGDADSDGDGDGVAESDGDEGCDCVGDGWLDVGVQRAAPPGW
jgi:hypothetical protein